MACKEVEMEENEMDKNSGSDELSQIEVFLNDEILEQIFGYLSPIELILMERVSKRWRDISLKSWRNKKKLSLGADLGYKFPLKRVVELLKRGGKYLNHLDMKFMKFYPKITGARLIDFDIKERYYPEKEIFKAISVYCHQLEFLHLFIEEYNTCCPSGKHLYLLEDSVFQNLKTFKITVGRRGAKASFEKRLTSLIQKAGKVEEFEISAECCTDGTCLLSLPKTCQKLSLHIESMSEEIFIKVLENLPNLKHLDIDSENIEPELLSKICNKLETLIVGSNEVFFEYDVYKDLSLENIKVFGVKENETVTDAVFYSLIEKLPLLVELNVRTLEKVSDEGFRRLGELSHLKSLDISYNDQITDETVTFLAKSLNKLETVICNDCKLLTCSGMLSLIDSCKSLKFLKVEGYKLNDEFLKSAFKSVDGRLADSSLTISVGKLPKDSKILIPSNDRQLKYNYCKLEGTELLFEGKWGLKVPVIRYVSSSLIDEV